MDAPHDDPFKVPAFMRKRELSRRSKKKILYTALDRKMAMEEKKGKNIMRRSRVRKDAFLDNSVRKIHSEERPSYSPSLVNPIFFSSFKQNSTETDVSDFASRKDDAQPKVSLRFLGTIEEFYEKISVAVIKLRCTLKVGDVIVIDKKAELVESIQINRQPVPVANNGDDIGIKLKNKTQFGAKVFVMEIL